MARSIIKKSDIQIGEEAKSRTLDKVAEIAKKKGVTLEHVMQRLKESLDATKVSYFQYEGEVIEERVDVDNSTRLNAVKFAGEVLGMVPGKADTFEMKNYNLNVNAEMTLNIKRLNNKELLVLSKLIGSENSGVFELEEIEQCQLPPEKQKLN